MPEKSIPELTEKLTAMLAEMTSVQALWRGNREPPIGYDSSPRGILGSYRDGYLSFDEAAQAIEEWANSRIAMSSVPNCPECGGHMRLQCSGSAEPETGYREPDRWVCRACGHYEDEIEAVSRIDKEVRR